MKTLNFIILAIAGFMLACTPVRVVSTEIIEKDFEGYKTFNFYEVQNSTSPYLNDLKKAVVSQLETKGYALSDNPDLMINIGSTVEEKVQTRETDYRDIAYMGQRNYSWQSEEVVVNQYKEGTVVLDFVDTKTDNLVWQGVAAGTISGKESEMIKRINKGVEMLFRDFPAQ
ncbi:DUF4136 domain-containing protein [Fulvivirga sedimenti]|uniref:DUF4136 domain-containing protein n=1 Tax=Fulvivirga sedimenti TaxID=2879465 RepID=A0A9X1KXV2_9BACT|nr:DUF4136 domain-containing protein [Fulvivirga sedimenti]MCA6074567.1 DUF4136 domain-containing protein [Fulvivirga sedimenti]MCA6075744.1 DUF4136 domain-containing protein [Fulvivirga sedimenti]MCA6076872.1 DUF4136 domain-containing protein [Fulvivirga sedimenti]